MGGFLGGGTPKQDNSARDAAEAQAREEQAALEAKQKEEESALRRGLRGRRALLSADGGELGFKTNLGV